MAPKIKDMESVQVKLKENAKLTCKATGDNIDFKWTIGSGTFPDKVTGVNSDTLMIPDVKSSDKNTYTCVASNEGGSDSSDVTLTVTGIL